MKFFINFDIVKSALRIIPSNLRKGVIKHAFQLSFIAIADFIGLAFLLPLLLSLLGGSRSEKIYMFWIDVSEQNLYTFLIFVLAFFSFKTVFYLNQQNKQVILIGKIIHFISSANIRNFLNSSFEKKMETNSSLFSEKVYFQPFLIGQGVYAPMFILLQETIVLFFILLALLIFYPFISLALMLVAVISGFIIKKWIKQHTISLGRFNIEKRKELFEKLNLNLSAILDIKQNQLDEKTNEEITRKVQTLAEGELKTNIFKNIPFRVNELIAVIGIIILILYAVVFNHTENFILMGSVFALALFRAIPAINRLQLNLVQLRLNHSHLATFFEEQSEVDAPSVSMKKLNQVIKLNGINIAYKDDSKLILDDISFEIPRGQITVFYGPSGSGKSSLLRIIAGQMSPKKGEVIIDKTVLSKENLSSWQQQIAFISQKPYIIKSSISENVVFGTDKEKDCKLVKEALMMSGLEEFCEVSDDYQVGEEGLKISEGQKQRLMLARAIYKNVPVLLLDEITANLDLENIEIVIKTLKKLRDQGKTIIAISHNKEIINIADRLCKFASQKITLHDN